MSSRETNWVPEIHWRFEIVGRGGRGREGLKRVGRDWSLGGVSIRRWNYVKGRVGWMDGCMERGKRLGVD